MTARPTIETERLLMRPPMPEDWEAFRAFFTSARSDFVGGDGTEGKAWRIFAIHLGQWQIHGFGSWVVTRKTDNAAVGLVGLWFPADWPEREIGWSIFDGFEGQGYALEAARETRQHAYDALGLNTVVSYIDPANTRSIALAERLGCTLDTNADLPDSIAQCRAYRHPAPEAVQ